MPSKLKKAIGAVKDQTSISFAKVANGATSDLTTLEVAILKATSHDEEIPIDDRLVSDILGIISSKKSHATSCAAAIGRRIGRTRNWIVAIKSLVLILRIFQDGDPYFPREILHAMKRGAKILNLSSFRDDSNSYPSDFTNFVRTYALYLDERLDCFLTGKLQRRYTNQNQTGNSNRNRSNSKLGIKSNEPAVRDMKPVMLIDKITYWQRLLDRAMATRPTGDAKSNKLVKSSLSTVVLESFDLYKDISDGLSILLDSFFHLQYQSCIHAFQACVRASTQFEQLNGFYEFCKSNSVGPTSNYPIIQKISLELLETLQEFLKDQSSFPASYPSPNSLLPPTNSSKESTIDLGDSAIDLTSSERYSDYGSVQSNSLEDLMSKIEVEASSPPMSCQSEPYGGRDDPNVNNFDTVSTKSLPNHHSVSNLTVDIVFCDEENKNQDSKEVNFDPWDALMLRDDLGKRDEEPLNSRHLKDSGNWLLALEETTPQVPENNSAAAGNVLEESLNSRDQKDSRNWLLALEETTPQVPENNSVAARNVLEESKDQKDSGNWLLALEETTLQVPENNSAAAGNVLEESLISKDEGDTGNWLLALEETVTQVQENNSMAIVPFGLGDSIPALESAMGRYNPFLEESAAAGGMFPAIATCGELVTTFGDLDLTEFKPEPTFQVNVPDDFEASFTPTFKAKTVLPGKCDPFASFESFGLGETFMENGGVQQQSVLQEQQLWLQNQNKIIAKHLN